MAGAGAGASARRALLWAAMTCLIAGAVGLVSYWTGVAVRGERVAGPPPPGPPGLVPLGDVYAAGERQGQVRAHARGRRALDRIRAGYRRGGRDYERILARGRRQGMRAALRFPEWRPGGWYVVEVADGGRSLKTRVGPLEPGRWYSRCGSSVGICGRAAPPERRAAAGTGSG